MKSYKGTCTPHGMNWQVTVDGKLLKPRYDLRNHSPDGFSWGYSGSGPAQLSLAILADCTDDETAMKYYQDFKAAVIARFDMNEPFELTDKRVLEILEKIKLQHKIKSEL